MSEVPQPTPKDAALFQVILTSMKNKPEVDWAIVAQKAGYKDAKSASTRYGQIIKKLTGLTGSQALAGTTVSGEVRSSPAKKGKAVGSGTNKLASKVTKPKLTIGGAKKVSKVEILEDEAEIEEIEEDEIFGDDADEA